MISNAQWFLLVGVLMLAMGLTSNKIKDLPFTTSIIYLLAGLVLGPVVLNVFQFHPIKESALLELLTESAVLISLFSVGVKMPYPFKFSQWKLPILLASVSMLITVSLVAAFSCYVLGLPLGAGILLGAIIAPTDPVLATDVQTREPGDRDLLRFTLSCEAGMNDGTAFPFVVLGLGLLGLDQAGNVGLEWAWLDLLWATAGGIAIGLLAGKGLAWLTGTIRGRNPENTLKHEFLSLGLIGVVYGLAVMAHTWGFLAVFFASVALHQAELRQCRQRHPHKPESENPPIPASTQAYNAALSNTGQAQSAGIQTNAPVEEHPSTVSEDSLVFKEYLERLSEVIIILLVGGMMLREYWNWHSVAFALFLFLVARPLSVLVVMAGSKASWRITSLVGWFGIRGIGSLYYLMYAIQHGLPLQYSRQLIEVTLVVITLSILLHGTSVKPMLNLLWRRRKNLR